MDLPTLIAAWHPWATQALLWLSLATVISTALISAPYGRHVREGWGPTMPQRWGWMVMESPTLWLFGLIFLVSGAVAQAGSWALLALWLYHYLMRTLVWPFKLADPERPMPVVVAALAFTYNLLNAFVQAGQLGVHPYPASWLLHPAFLAGAALFFLGEHINRSADATLLALRREGGGYRIPRGPLYRWISCPNYAGEILAWIGWAVATWSLAGLAFALFTMANLVPRALTHHRWYRETFPDYPSERRAIVPWVL